MQTLALAEDEELETAYANFSDRPEWHFARKPETGLIMAQGRIGGGGAAFNIGEISTTRAVVTLATGETGYAYCKGRNQRRAAIIAFFDAVWQHPSLNHRLKTEIIQVLNQNIKTRDNKCARETAATKVDFFTLVRGDD